MRVRHPNHVLSNHVKSLGVYIQVGGGFMVYIENCLIVLEPHVEGLWEHMHDVGNLISI